METWSRICYAFCIFGPLLLAAGLGAVILWKRGTSAARRSWVRVAFAAALALPAIYLGATKRGTVTVSDDYIADAGSYLTNDIVHVAISKKTQVLPDDTEILVYVRELSQSNATDWVRLSPHLTFADHPYDYALPNATNYNVMVAASFTPSPTVHTNGVWVMRGFEIPNQSGKYAFGNSKIAKREAKDWPYKYRVEYLESTGTQYIDTGLNADSSLGYEIDAQIMDVDAVNGDKPFGVLQRSPLTRHHMGLITTVDPRTWDILLGEGSTKVVTKTISGSERLTFKVDTINKTASVGSVSGSWSGVADFDTNLSFYLFGRHDSKSDRFVAAKLWSAKFYINGTLVADLIPVVDDNGVACMFDRVTKTFFYNKGSGSFTAGPRVN